MSLVKNIGKVQKWIADHEMKIALSVYRKDDGFSIDYDVYSGERLYRHVCSYDFTEDELKKFVGREVQCLSKSQ